MFFTANFVQLQIQIKNIQIWYERYKFYFRIDQRRINYKQRRYKEY